MFGVFVIFEFARFGVAIGFEFPIFEFPLKNLDVNKNILFF